MTPRTRKALKKDAEDFLEDALKEVERAEKVLIKSEPVMDSSRAYLESRGYIVPPD